jgi:hypothetical protein
VDFGWVLIKEKFIRVFSNLLNKTLWFGTKAVGALGPSGAYKTEKKYGSPHILLDLQHQVNGFLNSSIL